MSLNLQDCSIDNLYQNFTSLDFHMNTRAVGIDISKQTFDVCLLDGERRTTASFDNNEKGFSLFKRWLKKQKAHDAPTCLEATGRYGDNLATYLFKAEIPVSIVNPIRIKAYARSRMKRNKTDRIDSHVIAHFCLTQVPEKWTPTPPHIEELQALTRYLQVLKEERVRLVNRLKSGLTSSFVINELNEQKAFLDQKIRKAQQAVQAHIVSHPDLKDKQSLLFSISGIGLLTASLLLAEIPDISQFQRVEQLTAFAGLSPKLTQSGTSVNKHGGISKVGRKRLRTVLYMPALVAMRHNPIVKKFAERLLKRGVAKMVVVVACMRKLLHLAYGVLKTGCKFDPNYLERAQNTP